jgi:hypothetical protein
MRMKYVWVLLLLAAGVVAPRAAQGQAELYGQFSVSDLANPSYTDYLYGATTGILVDGPTLFHHVLLSADIQGRFVRKTNESLNGVTVGPRFSLPLKKHGLTPYGEFMVGFARFNSTYNFISGKTTDAELQVNAGVAKRVSPRWDVSLDYSYAQYYADGGEYNPKTFSAGAIFHFVKR